MASTNIDFSRLVNTDIDTTPFQMVVFGSHSPVLEVELNEMQMLQANRLKSLIKGIVGNVMSDDVVISIDNNNHKLGINGIITVGGYVINCVGMDVDISGAASGDYVVASVKEEVLDSTSTVHKCGYDGGGEIDNTIKDDRFEYPTTKRIAIKLSLDVIPHGEFFSRGEAENELEICILLSNGDGMSVGQNSHRTKITTLIDDAIKLGNTVNAINSDISAIYDVIRAINSNINTINGTVNTHTTNLASVKSKVDGIKPDNTIVLTNKSSTTVGAIWYE